MNEHTENNPTEQGGHSDDSEHQHDTGLQSRIQARDPHRDHRRQNQVDPNQDGIVGSEDTTEAVPLEGLGFHELLTPGQIARAEIEIAEGKLPPPAMLNGYNELVPGTAERMIESYLAHEHAQLEQVRANTKNLTKIVNAESFGVKVGASLGIVSGVVLVAGVAAATFGAPWGVAIVSAIPLVITAATGYKNQAAASRKEP